MEPNVVFLGEVGHQSKESQGSINTSPVLYSPILVFILSNCLKNSNENDFCISSMFSALLKSDQPAVKI